MDNKTYYEPRWKLWITKPIIKVGERYGKKNIMNLGERYGYQNILWS